MNEMQKERIEALTTFCGYGNPETAEIFFMGIEEHDTFQCNGTPNALDSFIEGLSRNAKSEWTYKDISESSMGSAKGATERIQCKIYQELFADRTTEIAEIFKSRIHCFNLYPLGANKQDQYPLHYNDCFGFDFNNKSDLYYYFDKHPRRNDILKSFITKQIIGRGKLLFVLGISNWLKIEPLLDIEFNKKFDGWLSKRHGRPSMIKWSVNRQVWLTGHPSHQGINSEVIEKIAKIRRDN